MSQHRSAGRVGAGSCSGTRFMALLAAGLYSLRVIVASMIIDDAQTDVIDYAGGIWDQLKGQVRLSVTASHMSSEGSRTWSDFLVWLRMARTTAQFITATILQLGTPSTSQVRGPSRVARKRRTFSHVIRYVRLFLGTAFALYASKKNDRGQFLVDVDAVFAGTGDAYDSTTSVDTVEPARLFAVDNLAAAQHTVIVWNSKRVTPDRCKGTWRKRSLHGPSLFFASPPGS